MENMKKETHRKFWVIILTVIAFLMLSVSAHVTTIPAEDILIEDPIELEAWMTEPFITLNS